MTLDESSPLGLRQEALTELFARLVPTGSFHNMDDAVELEDLSARLKWSQLIEPGDELAGQLIAELGATQALQAVRTRGGVVRAEETLWLLLKRRDSSLAAEGQESKTRESLRGALERWLQRDNNAKLIRDLRLWIQLGGWVLSPSSPRWPQQFEDLGYAAPVCIWGRGDSVALTRLDQSVSIVGSRNTTAYGNWITSELATRLGEQGYCIVSGGAYGIDSFAHQAIVNLSDSEDLEGVAPTTIAVMAGGADRLYPIGNTALLNQVMSVGCVISELPPGNAPTKWRFLQRNRLIAALGQTLVVVEMAYRSGALNTVHHALQIGRRVIAVPGSILSPTSQGCNQVIQDGKAEAATSFEMLLALAKDEVGAAEYAQALTPIQSRVFDAVSNLPRSVLAICQNSGTGQIEASGALAELELMGFVSRLGGKWKRTDSVKVTESPQSRTG